MKTKLNNKNKRKSHRRTRKQRGGAYEYDTISFELNGITFQIGKNISFGRNKKTIANPLTREQVETLLLMAFQDGNVTTNLQEVVNQFIAYIIQMGGYYIYTSQKKSDGTGKKQAGLKNNILILLFIVSELCYMYYNLIDRTELSRQFEKCTPDLVQNPKKFDDTSFQSFFEQLMCMISTILKKKDKYIVDDNTYYNKKAFSDPSDIMRYVTRILGQINTLVTDKIKELSIHPECKKARVLFGNNDKEVCDFSLKSEDEKFRISAYFLVCELLEKEKLYNIDNINKDTVLFINFLNNIDPNTRFIVTSESNA